MCGTIFMVVICLETYCGTTREKKKKSLANWACHLSTRGGDHNVPTSKFQRFCVIWDKGALGVSITFEACFDKCQIYAVPVYSMPSSHSLIWQTLRWCLCHSLLGFIDNWAGWKMMLCNLISSQKIAREDKHSVLKWENCHLSSSRFEAQRVCSIL